MLRLESVTVSVGGRTLLSDANWHLRPGEKVGLVGRNGVGKTTLLRIFLGEHDPESGQLHLRGGLSLGYLPQQAVSGSTRELWDEVRSGMIRLNRVQAQLAEAERSLDAGEPDAVEVYTRVEEAFRIAGGYAIEERIGEVLHGLGFRKDVWRRTCDTFSGGWQMRIALARLLLSDPDLLLLDEPTNHLDLLARGWLAGFLDRWRGTAIIVSHDRHLLDRACSRIVELSARRLHSFTGNFSAWLVEREQREAQARAAYEAQQAEIERLERFVARFRAQANKASQARSRQRVLDKMERLEPPERAGLPHLRLPPAPACAVESLVLKKVAVGWPDQPRVLHDVELVVERGMRLAVLGPNGCGKSTLLGALSGRLPLTEGRRHVGHNVRIGVFTQDLAQELDAAVTPIEHLRSLAPITEEQYLRAALGALGLHGDMALRPIGSLSGGERARVALAALTVRKRNVLLLDEPTNHLDAVTVEVLVRALQDFEGAMVLVSHDRYLVERLATHVAHIRDGGLTLREGLVPEDFELLPMGGLGSGRSTTGARSHADRKRLAREQAAQERAMRELEASIEQAEERLVELDEELAAVAMTGDHAALAALAESRRALEARIASLYQDWEAAHEA